MLVFSFYLFSRCEQSIADKNTLDFPAEFTNVSEELINGGMLPVREGVLNANQDISELYFANCVKARYAMNGGFTFVSNVASTIDHQPNLISVEENYLNLLDLKSDSKDFDVEVFAINGAENGIPMI